ncbi:MAG: ECF-type sigma factor, partial [Wenzhouxiangella sp.]|nr:ECF-type sigma factor [Wenzhouxiangella sp.]
EKISRSAAFNARDRAHFFGCAAHAMRQIVIDQARAKAAEKRGGGLYEVTFDDAHLSVTPDDAIRLDEALRRLEEIDPAFLELVELRFFTGLSMEQIAEATEVSVRTLHRRWRLARSALQTLLDDVPDGGAAG